MRLRRAGLVAGAVLSTATFGVPAAQAAPFTVTNLNDVGGGSLRDAVDQADTAAGDDTITFQPGLTGQIDLQSPISISPTTTTDGLTITGPGQHDVTVSGDIDSSGTPNAGDTQLFVITAAGPGANGPVSMSRLTLTNGYDPSGGTGGGAIVDDDGAALTLTDLSITNSTTDQTGGGPGQPHGGGAVAVVGDLTLTRTTISGNSAPANAGGGVSAQYGDLRISDSTISGNTASDGGGVYHSGALDVEGSRLTDNHATGSSGVGGGLFVWPKYVSEISDSVISGNTAVNAGGLYAGSPGFGPYVPYSSLTVRDSTISANEATHGAGVWLGNLNPGSEVSIERSTLSGNQGGAGSFGGGLLFIGGVYGTVDLLDSTVSGNTATTGGGISLGYCGCPLFGHDPNGHTVGAIHFDNSTIASNSGAGIYLGSYTGPGSTRVSGSVGISSTVVAGNTANGQPLDLDRADDSTSGGFDSAFSLIGQPGDAPLLTKLATITGTDPQLGALGDHGGPTFTQLPAGTSPLIDAGKAPASLTLDQRGLARTVDTGLANPSGGDGTDIGAVELPASEVTIPPPPPGPSLFVGFGGRLLGSPVPPLLASGYTPVVCGISAGTITSCIVEVRALADTNTRSTSTTVTKGTVLGSASATSLPAKSIALTVRLSAAGRRLLAHRPLGVDAGVVATASGSGATPATIGKVHLIAGRSIRLSIGRRTTTLPSYVVHELDQASVLLRDAKSITCTAYSDRHRNDKALTQAQADAACARLKTDGYKGTLKSVGRGHAHPIASNRSRIGRATNRRVVLTFTF